MGHVDTVSFTNYSSPSISLKTSAPLEYSQTPSKRATEAFELIDWMPYPSRDLINVNEFCHWASPVNHGDNLLHPMHNYISIMI
jgi:hypothetical protein